MESIFIRVASALSQTYDDFNHNNKSNPLNELLFVICSRKTNRPNYMATYLSLKRRFPRFEFLANASQEEIRVAIAKGGLSNQRARAIRETMEIIVSRFGNASLAPLKELSDGECEEFLTSLPWVGKKTARCVMMYSLARQVFPVDTHCWRVCRRLGWVRKERSAHSCTSKDMDKLQEIIPAKLRHSLHVNMVSLGRDVCTAGHPSCHKCPIEDCCGKVGVK